jgi:5'-3' exoribonuclease 1
MGVEYLYGQWIAKCDYPGVRLRRLPPRPDSLLLDFNGLVHGIMQIVYSYQKGENPQTTAANSILTDDQLEAKAHLAIGVEIERLLTLIQPTKTLVIAFDGVAPKAKMGQQRTRRFDARNGKEEKPEDERFSPSYITPGTEYMIRLDGYMRSWIAANINLLPQTVIYSSHMSHGEGEHKIFKYFNDGTITSKGIHVVYGLDADLNILALLNPNFHFMLVRENLQDIVDINALRNGVLDDIRGKLYGLNLQIDPVLAIQDFIMMVYLAGNDFLPRIFAFHDIGVAVNLMIKLYRIFLSEKKVYITDSQGIINWTNFGTFLIGLVQEEENMLKYKASLDFTYPSKILDNATVKTDAIDFRDSRERFNKPKYTIKSFSYDKFREGWYNNIFCPKSQGGYDVLQRVAEDDPTLPLYDESDVTKMSNWYLYGLQWILQYYRGAIDSRLFTYKPPVDVVLPMVALDYMYPYRYSPLLRDLFGALVTISQENLKLPLDLPIKPIFIGPHHQLVAVLPPSSSYLIPKKQRHLIEPFGELAYLSPVSFLVEYEAKYEKHQGVPILPYFDLDKIIYEVDKTLEKHYSSGAVFPTLPRAFQEQPEFISHKEDKAIEQYKRKEEFAERGRGRGRGGFVPRPQQPSVQHLVVGAAAGGAYVPRGRGRGRGNAVPRGRGRGRGQIVVADGSLM